MPLSWIIGGGALLVVAAMVIVIAIKGGSPSKPGQPAESAASLATRACNSFIVPFALTATPQDAIDRRAHEADLMEQAAKIDPRYSGLAADMRTVDSRERAESGGTLDTTLSDFVTTVDHECYPYLS
jgi:hypothetical protein